MSGAQRRSYDELSSRFCVPFTNAVPLDYASLFGSENPVTLEIGFGMGAATAGIAGQNPDKNYLAVEVYRPGIGRLLWEIEGRGLTNIRIIEHDGVEVVAGMIRDRSLAAVHLFFPDPWPKKRHHKRRLLTRPFTDLLARKLLPGAYLYMVTDWADYGDWALRELSATGGLRNPYGGFAPPRLWRPPTEFEKKALARQSRVWELYFEAEP
jgi:tRNA (guanine-N7-)-methyltransferase